MASVVLRIWRTGLDGSRAREYDEFANIHSVAMFERHDGFRGVFFAKAGEERVVITLWRDGDAAAALERSSDYHATVRAIEAAGFLRQPQRVELLEVQESHLDRLTE